MLNLAVETGSRRSFDCRKCSGFVQEPAFSVGFRNASIFTSYPNAVSPDGLRVVPRRFECSKCKKPTFPIVVPGGRVQASRFTFGARPFWLCWDCTTEAAPLVGVLARDLLKLANESVWLCSKCTARVLEWLKLPWEEAAKP